MKSEWFAHFKIIYILFLFLIQFNYIICCLMQTLAKNKMNFNVWYADFIKINLSMLLI